MEEHGEGDDEGRKRAEWPLVKWALIVFALNLASVLMLALRSSVSAPLHEFFDIAILLCLTGGIGYALARAMLMYPSHILDLININILVGLGIDAALEIMSAMQRHSWYYFGKETSFRLIDYIEGCMLAVAVLISGAAMGLRHCHLLKIDSAVKRAVTLTAGMLALPAIWGIFFIPLFFYNDSLRYRPALNMLLISAAWFVSVAVTLLNFVMAVKSLVLKTEITEQEKPRP